MHMLGFMRKITKIKLAKIKKLSGLGFGVSEIARTLQITDETVRKYLGGSEDDEPGHIKINERNKKRRRDNDPGKAGDGAGRGDTERSDSDPSDMGEGIDFVGGGKTMDKKEGSGAKEEDEYQCYNCGYIGAPFTECPKCGVSVSVDE